VKTCYVLLSCSHVDLCWYGKVKNETVSIIVWCQRDSRRPDTICLQLVRVDTGEDVRLGEGVFLLRVPMDEDAPARCLIRHLTTGQEAYVQGGINLRAFVKAYLLEQSES
jgi:hypothetical protein